MSRVINPFELPVEVYQQFMQVDEDTVNTMKDSHYERHQLMSEFKYLYAMDESVRQIGLLCLRALPQPDFSAIYFRGIDIISHCALKYTPEKDASVSDEEVRRFGETVTAYYRYSDTVLGEIAGAVSPDTAVVVVSDHGFEREPDGRFGHRRKRPSGLLIAAGGPFKGGNSPENVTLYDIAPTLLYLAGLPTSLEMDGRVLSECIEKSFLRTHPCSSVDSYGPPLRQRRLSHLKAKRRERSVFVPWAI